MSRLDTILCVVQTFLAYLVCVFIAIVIAVVIYNNFEKTHAIIIVVFFGLLGGLVLNKLQERIWKYYD